MNRNGLADRPQSRLEGKSNRPSKMIAHGSQFSQKSLTDYIIAHKNQAHIDMSPDRIGRWLLNRDIEMQRALDREGNKPIVTYDISRVEKVSGEAFDAHINAWREAEAKRVESLMVRKTGKGGEIPADNPTGAYKPIVTFNKPKRGGFFKGEGKGSGEPSQRSQIAALFSAFASGRISAEDLAAKVAKVRGIS